ncbi:MAG: phytochelatin synthase family protein [Elusimicrobiales bacterium]|jgi:hypothetical protein
MKHIFIACLITAHLTAFCDLLVHAQSFIPKYGPDGHPNAVLLKAAPAFIRKSPAPDFWALIPYYDGMLTGHSASAASAATVLNGLRKNIRYSSSDELVTEESLLKKVTAENWAARLAGEKPTGVNLAQLGSILNTGMAAYGLTTHQADALNAVGAKKSITDKFRRLLRNNELSDSDFIIAHYMQSSYTGDPEGAVGTYSAVGAYDPDDNKVLILETDRKYYEPYWISLDTFIEGLIALTTKGKTTDDPGGLIWIHPKTDK